MSDNQNTDNSKIEEFILRRIAGPSMGMGGPSKKGAISLLLWFKRTFRRSY
jgi:hypothetical protein